MPVIGRSLRPIRVDRSGEVIIGQYHGWTDENPVGQRRWFVHQGVVLDFAVIAYCDPGTHVGTPTDDAVAAELGALANLGKVPNGATLTNSCLITNVSAINNTD